ncbi:MAG TPA: lipoyl synthase [Gammaproteobacteria bacterium]|nr:lipoyl synthase [Gammaproteobacteria bacterium]
MNRQKTTEKSRGRDKLSRIPVKVDTSQPKLPKPPWLKIKLENYQAIKTLKDSFRERKLVTVCEEAACPNLMECFGSKIATFMIMGDRCTRRCAFCDVAHGRPDPLDPDEPHNLAETVADMGLKFVVITSVDRDDLRDGGGEHFKHCIQALRKKIPDIQVEILVPDFRGRMRIEKALKHINEAPPDVFNHNLETVPRLYKTARAGSDYPWSLTLLKTFKENNPSIPTKSGIMLGLGESEEEIKQVLVDLRQHQVDMVTIGQYLQPSEHHMPVARYYSPDEFHALKLYAKNLGFTSVASGPLVRSSYHADKQAKGEPIDSC